MRVKHLTVYLYPDDIALAKVIGGGNVSAGIRAALKVFARVYTDMDISLQVKTMLEVDRERKGREGNGQS